MDGPAGRDLAVPEVGGQRLGRSARPQAAGKNCPTGSRATATWATCSATRRSSARPASGSTAILAGQQPDGWFGPSGLRTVVKGKPDLWPHMLVLNALQSYYEFSGDQRVLQFMLKYFRGRTPCRREIVRRRLLAADAVRRQPGERLLALQPHRRGVAAGPGPQDPREHGRLDQRRAQLAQREHRPVLPRAGRVLAAGQRPASSSRRPSGTTSR